MNHEVSTYSYRHTVVTIEREPEAHCHDKRHHHCDDDDEGPRRPGSRHERGSSAIDNLPIPNWLKRLLKESLREDNRGDGDGGGRKERLPSASSAGATIKNFQNSALGGEMLSAKQMDQMARTGYLTKKDGSTVAVPDEVQSAAKRYMANGGALFKKIESAVTGGHDGLLSTDDYRKALKDGTLARNDHSTEVVSSRHEYPLPSPDKAAKTICDFQKDKLGGANLSAEQMDQMARTGYLTKKDGSTVAVPPEVQDAAKRFMAKDAKLFKSVEAATTGKQDGILAPGDYYQAYKDGKLSRHAGRDDCRVSRGAQLLPSSSSAAHTIRDFQRDKLGGEMLDSKQMDQMARTGYLTKKDGSTIAVPAAVQDAAKRFMAHDGALFKKVESATTGGHDGLLATGDYQSALDKGMLSSRRHERDVVQRHGEYEMPSASSAGRTIRDFQRDKLGGEMLSSAQMDQMARTGYLTKKDGSTVAVPAEVQSAAQRFMAKGGELFKKIESATTGSHDGLLATGDYTEAVKDGTLSADGGGDSETFCRSNRYRLPTASSAAHTVRDFQRDKLGGEMLSSEQMDQMARTGYLTKKDGSTIAVPAEMQAAAQRFMAHDGALFKQVESAVTGKHDGLLATGDYTQALKDGTLSDETGRTEPFTRECEHDLPSGSSAAHTMRDFQKDKLGGAMLSETQMDQMARTGYLTKADGSTVAVPPEVQEAARRYMANGAELFKTVEAAVTGGHDGLLSTDDYTQAIKDGMLYEFA
ncbi:hypothetical protein ACFOLJ_03110 [Rugamonas sp. CCM 8940]|uniref:hypothetical protein n=1 Tax=Rugamonas sp. CCM 8940 TaxID=2765359 RepID=UPI0018F41975|nr:hypothetical protein [Rugamonas sp. CCM 8940]MBJ7311929.1 hypothetical protein [Rugamonas sp. CCM 8940]